MTRTTWLSQPCLDDFVPCQRIAERDERVLGDASAPDGHHRDGFAHLLTGLAPSVLVGLAEAALVALSLLRDLRQRCLRLSDFVGLRFRTCCCDRPSTCLLAAALRQQVRRGILPTRWQGCRCAEDATCLGSTASNGARHS
jgi:hypothetical protein